MLRLLHHLELLQLEIGLFAEVSLLSVCPVVGDRNLKPPFTMMLMEITHTVNTKEQNILLVKS